jgi:hypothetical protein
MGLSVAGLWDTRAPSLNILLSQTMLTPLLRSPLSLDSLICQSVNLEKEKDVGSPYYRPWGVTDAGLRPPPSSSRKSIKPDFLVAAIPEFAPTAEGASATAFESRGLSVYPPSGHGRAMDDPNTSMIAERLQRVGHSFRYFRELGIAIVWCRG